MAKEAKRLYKAITPFAVELADGTTVVVNRDQTVEEGHELLKGREEFFKLVEADYRVTEQRRVEAATANPGERRGE